MTYIPMYLNVMKFSSNTLFLTVKGNLKTQTSLRTELLDILFC